MPDPTANSLTIPVSRHNVNATDTAGNIFFICTQKDNYHRFTAKYPDCGGRNQFCPH